MPVLQSAIPSRATVHRLQLVLVFTAIYVVWGSTYPAMRYAVVSVPPLLVAGGRNVAAGGILYAWLRCRGVPSRRCRTAPRSRWAGPWPASPSRREASPPRPPL